MQTIDNRGLQCPLPVINTKKALDILTRGQLVSIVDNQTALKNVLKLAQSLGCAVEVDERENGFFLTLTKDSENTPTTTTKTLPSVTEVADDTVILCTSDLFGKGDEPLGSVLMKSFFYAWTEHHPPPKVIILMNRGVYLALEGSVVLESLAQLHNKGTTILSCGTCLDYYQVTDALRVGEVTNMYTVVELLAKPQRLICI